MAGKGGVGKTTVTAALARAAALSGLSSLIVEIEGKSGLTSIFGREPLDYEEIELSSGGGPEGAADIRARTHHGRRGAATSTSATTACTACRAG